MCCRRPTRCPQGLSSSAQQAHEFARLMDSQKQARQQRSAAALHPGDAQHCRARCPHGSFEIEGCTAARDRVCQPCRPCEADAYEEQPCGAVTDRVCLRCAPCPPGMHTLKVSVSVQKKAIASRPLPWPTHLAHSSGTLTLAR
jgi:hypothetical protein